MARTKRRLPHLQKALEDAARTAAPMLDTHFFRYCEPPTGFVLWAFHRNRPEFTLIGNIDPADMDAAMEQLVRAWKAGLRTRLVDAHGARRDPVRTGLPSPPPRQIERK